MAPLVPEPRLLQDILAPIATAGAITKDVSWLAKTDLNDADGIDDRATAGLVGNEGTMISPARSGRFVDYYRVSTQKQGRSDLGLQAQKTAVLNYLEGRSWRLVGEFTEIESHKRQDNPLRLAKALAACKKHKAKLTIAKLDRLPTNVAFMASLQDSKVEFIAADMPFANGMAVQLMSLFAEYERETIVRDKSSVRSGQGKR